MKRSVQGIIQNLRKTCLFYRNSMKIYNMDFVGKSNMKNMLVRYGEKSTGGISQDKAAIYREYRNIFRNKS